MQHQKLTVVAARVVLGLILISLGASGCGSKPGSAPAPSKNTYGGPPVAGAQKTPPPAANR